MKRLFTVVFLKSFFSMLAGGVAMFLGTIIDGFFIGRYFGEISMSAYQLNMPVIMSAAMVTVFFAAGIQNLYSEYLGADKIDRAFRILSVALACVVTIGALMTFALSVFGSNIAVLLGAEPNHKFLYTETRNYMSGLSLGIVPLLAIPLVTFLLYMEGRVKVLISAIAAMLAVNILGDLSAVFVFKNGLFGIGLASSACYWAVIIVTLAAFVRKRPVFRFMFSLKDLNLLAVLFERGFPSGIERLLIILQISFVNHFLLKISLEFVAVYAVISVMNQIFSSIADAVATTTFTMGSVFYGEGDNKALRVLFSIFTKCALVIGGVVMLFCLLLARPLFGIFTENAQIADFGSTSLRMFILFFPFYTCIRAFHKYIQAMGIWWLAYTIPVCEYILFFVPCAYTLKYFAGSQSVWLAFLCSETLTVILIALCALGKKPAGSDSKILYECSIERGDDITKHRTCVQRISMYAALALEEMCKNIFQYNESQKSLGISVRLAENEGGLILRIRDNGRAFDPAKWLEIHKPKESVLNIGLRLVSGLAKSFRYINILGMNNLIINFGREGN